MKTGRKVPANLGVVPETRERGRAIQYLEMAVEMMVVSAAELDRTAFRGVSHLTCWVKNSLGKMEESTRTVEFAVI